MVTLADFPLYRELGIVQPDLDGGDMPQRTALYAIGTWTQGRMDKNHWAQFLDIIMSPDRKSFCRHPEQWPQLDDLPADQFDPVLIATFLAGFSHTVQQLLSAHRERKWFYNNGNPPNFGSISSLLRCKGDEGKFWISFWDTALLASAIIDCRRAKAHQCEDGNWWDMDNGIVKLAFARRIIPTAASERARRHYVQNFPHPMLCVREEAGLRNVSGKEKGTEKFRADLPPLAAALAWKHRPPSNNPAFKRLWLDEIKTWYQNDA